MNSFKLHTIAATLFMVLGSQLPAQMKIPLLTPAKPVRLIPSPLELPSKFKNNIGSYSVNIPEGYKASVFYAGRLAKSRFMTWGPDSVLYVANMNSGEILALPDKNHDHVADTAIVVAWEAFGHDLEFFNGDLYVAEEKKVLKFSDKDGDGIYESRSIFIDSIMAGKKRPPGGHTTRTIVFDEKEKKVYLSVGSSCNVCREEGRAVIFEYALDGKNEKIFASGTRNCVGMTLHPTTGKLWATNNGSDHLGNGIPPEWIDEIKPGGFYGYPFAYGYKTYFDFNGHEDYRKLLPITGADSALVKKMKIPAVQVEAHSAPMAIEFVNASFKSTFSNGAFVAYRGSWDRQPPTGYKIVYLNMENNRVNWLCDVVTGFLPDPQGKPWARPVGLLAGSRGELYMSSDDINAFIMVLVPIK